MDKALIIISDNNKGKYITKGFSSAFKALSYFVIERKIYDLNIEDVNKINPDIIFIFWTALGQKDIIESFFENNEAQNTIVIHCAELIEEIPKIYQKKKNHYCFAMDGKKKYLPSVNYNDYKVKFSKYFNNITFCGNPAFNGREEILSNLISNFGPINIYCRSFDFYKSVDEIHNKNLLDDYLLELYKSSYKGYVESQKELAQIYATTKINIDLENENKKYLNYRCLEILASGGFLIAPYNETIVKYFDDGKDLETYKTTDELIDKINFYLKNLNLAQLISANGRKNVASNHSFCDRLKSMLKVIYGKDFSNR